MLYKIKMMSGQEIPIESEEALQALLKEANSGKRLIVTKYGVVNAASIDSITEDKAKMDEVYYQLKHDKRDQRLIESEQLPPSPFAKLLAGKMIMLSPQSRSETQEDASKLEKKSYQHMAFDNNRR